MKSKIPRLGVSAPCAGARSGEASRPLGSLRSLFLFPVFVRGKTVTSGCQGQTLFLLVVEECGAVPISVEQWRRVHVPRDFLRLGSLMVFPVTVWDDNLSRLSLLCPHTQTPLGQSEASRQEKNSKAFF